MSLTTSEIAQRVEPVDAVNADEEDTYNECGTARVGDPFRW